MGNGTVIPITQTDTTHLYASNNAFKLSTILYAPIITCKIFPFLNFAKTN